MKLFKIMMCLLILRYPGLSGLSEDDLFTEPELNLGDFSSHKPSSSTQNHVFIEIAFDINPCCI